MTRPALLRNPWFWAIAAGLVLVPMSRLFFRHVPEPPAPIATLPSFSLVDQDGQAFTAADLTGEVWVVDFFFVSCPTICPQLTAAMKRLAEGFERVDADVKLLSITVDPENDTPERLREYATAQGIDTSRWRLLTGTRESIEALVVGGFGTHMGERTALGDVYDIAHATKFAIVDGQGQIRGYYDALSEEGLDEVFHRARRVLDVEREAAQK
jgi:protein SCO1/2